jgi:hypothetical protein
MLACLEIHCQLANKSVACQKIMQSMKIIKRMIIPVGPRNKRRGTTWEAEAAMRKSKWLFVSDWECNSLTSSDSIFKHCQNLANASFFLWIMIKKIILLGNK